MSCRWLSLVSLFLVAACSAGGDELDFCESQSVRSCECADGQTGVQRSCSGEDGFEPCQCSAPAADAGAVADAASTGDAGVTGCRSNGRAVPCWEALLGCFPAGDAEPAAHLVEVCEQVCALPASSPATRIHCDTECAPVSIDLAFCEASCDAVASERPSDGSGDDLCR